MARSLVIAVVTVATIGLLALVVILAGCSMVVSPGDPTSFGSAQRTAHFLACYPYLLGGTAAITGGVERRDDAAAVLAALQARQQSGVTPAATAACTPYLADLAASGSADAAAMLHALGGRGK